MVRKGQPISPPVLTLQFGIGDEIMTIGTAAPRPLCEFCFFTYCCCRCVSFVVWGEIYSRLLLQGDDADDSLEGFYLPKDYDRLSRKQQQTVACEALVRMLSDVQKEVCVHA